MKKMKDFQSQFWLNNRQKTFLKKYILQVEQLTGIGWCEKREKNLKKILFAVMKYSWDCDIYIESAACVVSWTNLLVPSRVLCLPASLASSKNQRQIGERLQMIQRITCRNKTNKQIKAEEWTHKRPELLGDWAIAFLTSCGWKVWTATQTIT